MQQQFPSRAFTIRNRHGVPIRGNVHDPEAPDSPVLVFCHGFTGFKDWGSHPYVAARFAKSGWTVIRFNFSLNGMGESPEEYTEMENFRRDTYSREVEDLGDVLDAAVEERIPLGEADTARIALLGHSRGGGIVILQAAADRRVRATAAWAAISKVDRWGARTKRIWRKRGVLEILNIRTQQRMPLGTSLLDDVERNAERLDILRAAASLVTPLLLVHGDKDVSVPVSEAHAIYAAADPSRTELEIVPKADHSFGALHPFTGTTPELERAVLRTRDWLRSAVG